MMDMGQKYGAGLFDPDDPSCARAERARKILCLAFAEAASEIDTPDGEAVRDIAGGLLVGLVGILAAHSHGSDEDYAAIRAGLLQLTPWAVDMVRSINGLPTLVDDRGGEPPTGEKPE